uniref:Uncharacterized protein n=1 Tax=Rhizophora mucronata TaxID=61149 RepID=A0A2P2PTG4_RHIMU
MKSESSNSISTLLSIQVFELSVDAATLFVDVAEQSLPICEIVTSGEKV